MSPWPRETRLENIRIIQLTDYCQYSPSCFSLQHSSRSFESLNTFPNWKKWVSHILILTVTSAMTVEGVYKVGHNTVSGFCLRIWNATKCIWLACWQIIFCHMFLSILKSLLLVFSGQNRIKVASNFLKSFLWGRFWEYGRIRSILGDRQWWGM